VLKGGGQDLTRTTGQVKSGEVESERKTINLKALKDGADPRRDRAPEQPAEKIEGEMQQQPGLGAFRSQILLELTRDGLRIQIVDAQNRRCSPAARRRCSLTCKSCLRAIGGVLAEVPNHLTLEGPHRRHAVLRWRARLQQLGAFVRTAPRVATRAARGWPARRPRVARAGAGIEPVDGARPTDDPTNRRISLVVMTRDAEDADLPAAINAANRPRAVDQARTAECWSQVSRC
jgi:chemotaxis protein MotB